MPDWVNYTDIFVKNTLGSHWVPCSCSLLQRRDDEKVLFIPCFSRALKRHLYPSCSQQWSYTSCLCKLGSGKGWRNTAFFWFLIHSATLPHISSSGTAAVQGFLPGDGTGIKAKWWSPGKEERWRGRSGGGFFPAPSLTHHLQEQREWNHGSHQDLPSVPAWNALHLTHLLRLWSKSCFSRA